MSGKVYEIVQDFISGRYEIQTQTGAVISEHDTWEQAMAALIKLQGGAA